MNSQRHDTGRKEMPEVVDAVLVADSARGGPRDGLRELSHFERRMLFHAPQAHIEMRVPGAARDAADERWLYGQYVPTGQGRPSGPVRIRVRSGRDTSALKATHVAEASEASEEILSTEFGDFAVPCPNEGAICVEFRPVDGKVLVRVQLEGER